MIEKIAHVEAEHRIGAEPRRDAVVGIVEHPGVIAARAGAPGREAGMQTLRIGRVEELHQAR